MSQVPTESFDYCAVISDLYVYPVKSCAGVRVQEAIVLDTGLEFDRAWMVVDDKGESLTQRELPRMALIQPQLKHHEMVLRAPGMLALHVMLDAVEAPVQVRIWGDEVAAFDMGAVAAQWFSDYLGTPARLVRFDPDHRRVGSTGGTDAIEVASQFSDAFALLVISQASLARLNSKLVASGSPAVSMARFRPNIVLAAPDVAGEQTPHDEDRLDVLHVSTEPGKLVLKQVKPCVRCPIPNIDPATAISSPEVCDMLQTYRADPRAAGAVTFGMNAVVLDGFEQTIKIGQAVTANYWFAC